MKNTFDFLELLELRKAVKHAADWYFETNLNSDFVKDDIAELHQLRIKIDNLIKNETKNH